jgi:uncharacterized protein YdaU (DUF1376 family)
VSWYPTYPGDYRRDTTHLSLNEHGAYRLALDHYYSTRSPLPADKAAVYRICGATRKAERKAVDSVLKQFFCLAADGYHNGRADAELAKQAERTNRLSESGRRGAEKKWGKDGKANGLANGHPNGEANGHPLANPQPQPQEAAAALMARLGKEVWSELEINPTGLPGEFRELLEGQYATAGGQSPIEILGLCMDLWEARHGKGTIPGKVARRAAEIRATSRPTPSQVKETPVLERESWQ